MFVRTRFQYSSLRLRQRERRLGVPSGDNGSGLRPSQSGLEFGARSSGEPSSKLHVRCDLEEILPELVFLNANPGVMHIERIKYRSSATEIAILVLLKGPTTVS